MALEEEMVLLAITAIDEEFAWVLLTGEDAELGLEATDLDECGVGFEEPWDADLTILGGQQLG
jgi:hypothetical protein